MREWGGKPVVLAGYEAAGAHALHWKLQGLDARRIVHRVS